MQKHISYIGKLNGVYGVWCDKKPEGIELEKELIFYTPEEGKIFQKGDELFTTVILKEGESIEDYTEIDEPEQPKEKNNA